MREVTVATPTDRVSAEVALSLLRTMKVPARLASSIEPNWTLGSAPGTTIDLRILVPEDRAAEARALLEEPSERPAERSIALEALLVVTLITSVIVGGRPARPPLNL